MPNKGSYTQNGKDNTLRIRYNILKDATDIRLPSKVHSFWSSMSTNKQQKSIQNTCRIPKWTSLQRHTDGQPTHEVSFSVSHYQRNANENFSELITIQGQDGHQQKFYKQ